METRNFSSALYVDELDGERRVLCRLAPYYDGTSATEKRPMLDVIERFAPGCFAGTHYIDDECHVLDDDNGLFMHFDIDANQLLRLAGRPVKTSVVFQPTVIEWEAGDDGTDIRWIRKAKLVEIGPADDETDPTWLDYWRKQRQDGCESMMLEYGVKTLTMSYKWSPASDAAIRETYNVEAR